jgi:hypothetical protein
VSAGVSQESRARRVRAGGVAREVRAVDPGSWDRAAIIAALRDWTALVGRAPRAQEWSSSGRGPGAARWRAQHPRWPSASTVVHHFGSWSAGLQAAGLPTRIVEHELPRRERVASALALRAAGESVRSIAEQLGVHVRTVQRNLAAGTCSGCGGPAVYGEYCRECAPRSAPAATREEIVAALRAWSAEYGAPPREPDWTNTSALWRDTWPRWPGTTTVLRVFGAWNAALKAASLPTRRYAWEPEQARERLAAWPRAHGRPPTSADAQADPDLPALKTCQQLFGSWNAALRAAGLTPGREAHWSEERVRASLGDWARWHRQHGRAEPSAASYQQWAARQPAAVPSASSIRRRFGGSWNPARLAADLPAARTGRPPAKGGPTGSPPTELRHHGRR